jgi:hypothetical protein
VTNSHPEDQIVRKRVCEACGHVWFTVELWVPSYAVGWSVAHQRKPVLRAPVKLRAAHMEAKDQLAPLRAAAERKSAEADRRYGM